RSGVWDTLIPVMEQSNSLQYRGRGGDGGPTGTLGYTSQQIDTVVASLSFVTGAHAFKTGFSDTWAQTAGATPANAYNLYYRFMNGTPNQLTMYGTPITSASKVIAEIGAYAQDRWTLKRSTLNAGIRYDQFTGGYPDQYLGPAPFQPTR